MKVRFNVVVTDDQEMYERDNNQYKLDMENDAMGTTMELPFHNERDEIFPIVIDMCDVVSFNRRDVYWNDERLQGVNIRTKTPPHYLPTILCPFDEFLKIYEMANRVNVYTKDIVIESIEKNVDPYSLTL